MSLNNNLNNSINLNTITNLNLSTKILLEIKTNFYSLNNYEVANFYSRMATYSIPQHHFIEKYRCTVARVPMALNWGPAGLRGCKSSQGCRGGQDFSGLNLNARAPDGALLSDKLFKKTIKK